MRITTILVPLDGSVLGETALPTAVELARQHGARLLLLRAAEAHSLPIVDPIQPQVEAVREAEEYLAAVRARLAEAGIDEIDTSVWYGAPAEAIVEAARYRTVDLIVMSSHGRSGLGRLVLGSVAETVLRGTRVPILLIRPGEVPVGVPFTTATAKEIAHV
jgi:nucleotide-binding universal stress UspA family protein